MPFSTRWLPFRRTEKMRPISLLSERGNLEEAFPPRQIPLQVWPQVSRSWKRAAWKSFRTASLSICDLIDTAKAPDRVVAPNKVFWKRGDLSFSGEQVFFNTKGGNSVITNSCNPRLNQQGRIQPSKAQFIWSLHRESDGNTSLCLQGENHEQACYRRQ